MILFHKFFWFFINIALIGLTVFIVVTLGRGFLNNPTVTTLERTNYPVSQLPFPGVSVCNINKISKRRANEFAQLIANASGVKFTKIENYVKLLGTLFDFSTDVVVDLLEFQKVLEKTKSFSHMKIRSVLRQLSTPCHELLSNCMWQNKPFNCPDLFPLRLTYEGFCCVFNYVKPLRMQEDYSNTSKVLQTDAGILNGLSFVINNNEDDYVYTELATIGANVHIFIPTDFPDKNSGGLYENLVNIGTENILQIKPTTFYSESDVRSYPLDKRECYFQSERETEFGPYSESDCRVDCRIDSMLALCDCVPFMIPVSDDEIVCTLSDIQCLSKYKDKWVSVAPAQDEDELGLLKREQQDSLRCSHRCYPACQDTVYSVNANSYPIDSESFGNNSMVHIFYTNRNSNLYKQDVVYKWFEILSNFGGVFGISMGVSWITVVQMFYFFIYRAICNLLKKIQ